MLQVATNSVHFILYILKYTVQRSLEALEDKLLSRCSRMLDVSKRENVTQESEENALTS